MLDDPIVSEIGKFRDEYAASFGYDLGRIVSDLQSRQGNDGRRIVDRTSQELSEQSNAPERPIARVPEGASTSAAG
jgi:hypothetical protein